MKHDGVLALTRIFLYNWHRLGHHLIDVEDSLYLAGHNGSGKSSVLDAIQLVLVADQTRIRYNSSAQERSARTLDSYVRGKIGENRYLRPGNTVGYVALEFGAGSTRLTLGVCIEAAEGQSPERLFFILPEAIDPGLLVSGGRPLPRRDLRQALRARRGARTYEQVGEYQEDMLNRLGGLNERFFDLFLRALTFQPIRDINTFVEQWLLDAHPLDVDALQKVVDRLNQLRVTAREVGDKIAALQAIVEQQKEVRTWRLRHAEYLLLAAFLRVEEARRRWADLQQRRAELAGQLGRAEAACGEAKAVREGAEQALLEAEISLRQSDVVRRRDELEEQIARLTREADRIRAVYAALLDDLRREAGALAPLRSQGLAGLEELTDAVADLTIDQPPDPTLAGLIEGAVAGLDAELEQAQKAQYALELRAEQAQNRRDTLRRELAQLRSGQKAQRDDDVERLRDRLAPILSERPPLLCDLLEIPEERWQNAVEALLGGRRFNIIVPPRLFDAALRELDRVRAAERIYDVGLIDLDRARSDGRRALPRSLAQQVRPRSDLLQPYIDTVLGDIICCETIDELRQHRRAVTPEVVLYGEYTVRALHPRTYTPWHIGARAQRSQIEARERELREVQTELELLEPQLRELRGRIGLLRRGRSLSNLIQRLGAPLDERPLRAEIAERRAELQGLDTSGVAALEREVGRLRDIAARERQSELQATGERARLEEQQKQLEGQSGGAQIALSEREQQGEEARAAHPHAAEAAEELLKERLAQPDLAEALRNAENTARNYETRSDNGLKRLIASASGFNTRFQFAALPNDIDEQRYPAELERLQATELPRYSERIEQAQREAEEELREHVLHRLREQIFQAHQKLAWINDALEPLLFHGDRYRFRAQPSEAVRRYHDLITDSQRIGSGSLFESDFYQQHKASFDEFYERLTRQPQSDAEQREQDRLIDYRHYLSYDIEIIHASGQMSRLSRIMGQTSGGETQTPFYLTIAASFVQLYRISERNQRPTIRLVAFDEAFSKMDQDRIGSTLELFQQFGLQIITATPLERCEYLVPKMCTSLVFSALGDGVLIEPYRNYAARLQEYIEVEE